VFPFDAGQSGFDVGGQRLADDLGVDGAEVSSNGSQKFFVRQAWTSISSDSTTLHGHPLVVFGTRSSEPLADVNHHSFSLWITGTNHLMLVFSACQPDDTTKVRNIQ